MEIATVTADSLEPLDNLTIGVQLKYDLIKFEKWGIKKEYEQMFEKFE